MATNRPRDSLASSNDTKPIQSNNLVPTPQPMTATLIFRRQLVRHKPDLLTASSERVQAATRKISSAA